MRGSSRIVLSRAAVAVAVTLGATIVFAADWPQWRGAKRDGRAAEFAAPASWPKELKQAWTAKVGDGVATPALVGDKVFVGSRENDNEVTRCLDAATGKPVWEDKHPAASISGPAGGFQGPRASPAVADGKVVTLGTRGTLTCLDANSGKVIWRKDDYKDSVPKFYTSASPMIVDGMAVAILGSNDKGGIVAYDLASGDEKWKWTGDGAAYASPVLMTIDGTNLIVAETERKIVALSAADGKLVWETPFAVSGRGYNAATPVVEGETIIYSGGDRGVHAVQLSKDGDKFVAKQLWSNAEKSVQFNSPVLKDGRVYGITAGNELFCLNAEDGKTLWTAQAGPAGGGGGRGRGEGRGEGGGAERREGSPPPGPGGPGGQGRGEGRGRGRGGGGGRGGYGSIVDAGSVMLALTPASELLVFEPKGETYKEVARIKVAATPTYAYPVVSDKRIFIKDQDSLTAYTVE